MKINTPPRLQPLTSASGMGESTLLLNEAASPRALFEQADSRLSAAQAMLFTVATGADARSLDGQDVENIAQAAQLLASDALDLMRAMHSAHLRATARSQDAGAVHCYCQSQGV
ncbi:hypothetical protein [Halomonas icarae]|uniref:DUF3077 domain-containing protein n=1 Tax=Halomonas icarae TaxID=2691040 RepID=A0A7X4VWH8_9GAMM|nr:hypothetical protein [Halomonas icarae]MDR5901039.1 hypothetical protein [Halomonas icarae]NAW11315.1 hypothetical protein [Halomonas icarae]